MRRPLALLFTMAFGLVVLGCSDTGPESPWIGKSAPEYRFKPITPGGDVTADAFKGKVVLLDFWATWCGPCIQIMPGISDLSKKHKDAGLVVLGVSTETPTTVERFRDNRFDPGYDLVIDAGAKVNQVYGVNSLPTTVLIGRDGKVRLYEVGADPDQGLAKLEEAIVKALAEKA